MNTDLQNARTFENDYCTYTLHCRVKDIADDMRSSHSIYQLSFLFYYLHVRITRLLIKFPDLLEVVEKLFSGEERQLRRAHFDHQILYNAEYDDLLIYPGALEECLSGKHWNIFHAESFFSRSKDFMSRLSYLYYFNGDNSKTNFKEFLDSSIQNTKSTVIKIRKLYKNQISTIVPIKESSRRAYLNVVRTVS